MASDRKPGAKKHKKKDLKKKQPKQRILKIQTRNHMKLFALNMQLRVLQHTIRINIQIGGNNSQFT